MLGLPTAQAAQFPIDAGRRGTCRRYVALQDVRGVDEQALRQQVVGVDRRRLHAGSTTSRVNSFPQNPNMPGVEDRTDWSLKAAGSYDAPWGIRLSPVLRHQSGVNFARTITRARHRRQRLRPDVPGVDDLRRAAERQPRGQHLGVRRPRREDRELHASASARGCSSTSSTSPTATRRRRSAARRARLPAAGDHPRAVHGAGRLPVPLVGR